MKNKHSMTIEFRAARSVMRKQRAKTYAAQLLWIPIAIGFLFSLLFYFLMFLKTKSMVQISGVKLRMQKEVFKRHKKERKIEHKETKKQLKQETKVAAKVENNTIEIKLLNAPKAEVQEQGGD